MREFKIEKAVREKIPLNIGLWSPSGGGKTFSALRLATGIQRVFPGEIVLIDTENERGKHYADDFEYHHVDFQPPFSPLDYIAVLEQVLTHKPSVVIVDSFSYEHEWILEEHDRVALELAKKWNSTFDKVSQAAWGKAKAPRKELIRYLRRTKMNVILCFQAKEKTATVRKNGKTSIDNIGYQPIAGKEYVFDMSVSALLYPGSEGKAYFRTGMKGEDMMTKLEEPMKKMFPDDGIQLTESHGEQLATWAKGDSKPASKPAKKPAKKPDNFPVCIELEKLIRYLDKGKIPDKQVTLGKEKVNLLEKSKGAIKYLKGLKVSFTSSVEGYKSIIQIIELIEAEPEKELDVSRDKDKQTEQELDIF